MRKEKAKNVPVRTVVPSDVSVLGAFCIFAKEKFNTISVTPIPGAIQLLITNDV
jgi:hypothetical protein